MAEVKNITVNIEIHGTLDADIVAEEVKYHLRREVERIKASESKLKVGDYAKVTQKGHCNEGKIVEILSDDYAEYYPFNTKLLNSEEGDCHRAEQLIRATDEEVTKAKLKLLENAVAEKWAKLGRKPNEFKEGDIVRGKRNLGDGEYIIGEIKSGHRDADGSMGVTSYADGEYRSIRCIELITPVESRFDR